IEISSFLLLLSLSLLTDGPRLTRVLNNLDRAIITFEGQLIDANNRKATAEEQANTLEDRLRTQARESGRSITNFVTCLYSTSGNYYQPEIYRSTWNVCCLSSNCKQSDQTIEIPR
uniref:Uncharacterized protein n=1 Tax=Trichobilharzia regenti TaxID=157069 RepID=A0AA85KE56_TRIRE